MKEIRGLTGLRGIAALWVFFLHATWGWSTTSFALQVAKLGGTGITIFFVLSGFILSYVYQQQFMSASIDYKKFLIARFARVYPLHLALLLLYAVLAAAGIISLLPQDDLYTFLLNLGLIQAWGFTDLVSWNQPAWLLSSEVFAYLLFPFAVVAIARTNVVFVVAAAAVLMYSIEFAPYNIIVTWAINHGFTQPGKQFANGLSLVQFFSIFLQGCLLYRLMQIAKVKSAIIFDLMTALGIVLILNWCREAVNDLQPWQGVTGASLLVAGLSGDTGFSARVFGNRIVLFLGKISYSLYLSAILIDLLISHFIGPLTLWEKLVTSLASATALHYMIELPARRWIRKIG